MNHFTVRRLLMFSFCLMGLHAFAQEPTNYPTVFTATTQSGTSVKLDWTGSTGANLPSNYIILVRTPAGTFSAPADNDPAVNDNDLSDDLGSVTVPHAVGANTYTWTGLPIDTDLEFVIYPYKTGGTPDPNYKNDATAPTATASTKRPTVTSPTVGGIGEGTATLGGTVTDNGGNTILERGTVWNTTGTVLATDNLLAEGGTGVTAFTHARTVTPGVRIYYAAYARNVAGTSLSPESSFLTFSTVPPNNPASVTATAVSSTQINLTFSSPASTGVLTKGYIIVRNIGAAPPTSVAQDGVAPGSISFAGCPDCALVATITPPTYPLSTTSFPNSGLTPGTDYYYAVIPFNWNDTDPETYNYRVGSGFTVDNDVTFDNNSSIVLTGGGGGTTSNINYRTTAALSNIDNNDDSDSKSVSLATFQLQDGGGSAGGDVDGVGTTLTSLTIQITNWENLNRISLFDGGDEVAGTEQPAAASVTFDLSNYDGVGDSGPLSTTDGGTNNFNIRAIFNSTPGAITDNESIHLLITGATVISGGSQLAAANAGGATTTTAGAGVNNVVVNSTRLRFFPNSASVTLNSPFTLEVRAVDNTPYSNTDLDYNSQIDLLIDTDNSTGNGDLASGPNFHPFLTNGKYTWTNELVIDEAGQYQLLASDDDHSNNKLNGTANVTVSGTSVNITAPTFTDPNGLCFGGDFLTLGNIVIAEADAAGFSAPGGSLSLSLPPNFVFDPGVTTAPSVGASTTDDISAPSALSYSAANTVVTFSYTIGGTADVNSITISGLRIKYTGTAEGNFFILRSGGTAVIAGDAVSDAKVHATLKVDQPDPPVTMGFTVTSTDAVAINPNETNFSNGSNPINLVGSVSIPPQTGTNSFSSTGGGVTLVGSQYRFNPASLSPGTYPVTYTYTDATARACQHTFTKPLTVYASGINNLAPVYCNNDPVSGALSVDQSFLNQIGPGLSVDRFVYYNFATFSWINITNPDNTHFNPSLPEYQGIYNGGLPYGYPTGIIIGFYVCDGAINPCNGASTRFGRWQVVEVRPAPSPSINLATTSFCEDAAPITLVGVPANTNNIAVDNFTASGGQSASISHNTVGPNEVWTFSPAAVSGVTSSTSQTFNLIYKYTDPVTGCDASVNKSVTVHDRPTQVPSGVLTPGAPHSIELCQGGTVGSFTASDPTYTYRWYSDNPTTNLLRTGAEFTPTSTEVDNTIPQTNFFYVTRERNGCESSNNPLAVTVVVKATPPPPTIADPTLEYCVNENVPDIVATGTSVKWYTGSGAFILQDPSPSRTQLGIDNTLPGDYSFYATQTASGCEGFIPGTAQLVTVKIKALPNLALSANIPDVTRICTTYEGTISFSAVDQNDGNPAPNGTWSGTGLSGALNPFPVQGKTDLNPLGLLPGDYTLQYAYTSAVSNCSNTKTIGLSILPTITPNVSIGDVCDGFPAEIENNSSINPTSSLTTIAQTEWTLGDGSTIALGASGSSIPAGTNGGRTAGTYLNPTHIYPNVGTFQISGAMVTSDGCRYTIPQQPVTVSPIPQISFTWRKACRDGTSETEFLATENSTPQVPIAVYDWNFNMNNTLTYASAGTGSNPTVNYDTDGTDVVRLIVTSPAQCKDTVQAPVYVVPSYPVITEDNAYSQSFDAGANGWIAGGANASWALGNPQGSVVIGDASEDGSGNAWDTNLTGISNSSEQSWVLSPCFDFTLSQKPIISLDIWSDTPFQNDGAVLQYNENGDIANDAAWITIGQDNGQGANWYDASGISSSPGNQAANDVGWTGLYNGWRTAAFKLDNLKGKSGVVFRIAFASNTPRREGFSFDNVFVGERTRTVLLESFTNTSAGANAKLHNDVFRAVTSGSNEVAKIEFHTAFPGVDPLNAANVEINNSRAAFYGITNTKMFSVDGNVVGTQAALNTLYDARVLTPSPLRIDINITKVDDKVLINSTLTNTTNAVLHTTGVNVFTTIVEKSITDDAYLGNGGDEELTFVAKEMLPTAAGVKLTEDIDPLETINVQEVVWRNRDLITAGNGAVVVYVQSIEGGNKNVYQAKIVNATEEPDVITGNEPTFTDQIIIYPNPATHELNVKLPAKSRASLPITLTDNFGRNVFTDSFKTGEQTKVITTTGFAAGVYILQIQSDKGEIARKKVIVVGGR